MQTATKEIVRERPILFSSSMVKKILSGEKTQTRRIVKVRNDEIVDLFDDEYLAEKGFAKFDTKTYHARWIDCPYGKVGDRLWVRETFVTYSTGYGKHTFYRADDSTDFSNGAKNIDEFLKLEGYHWKPSIFMPKLASRITLEITNIRVQRIQEISIDDVLAEGIKAVTDGAHANQYWREETGNKFIELWQEINGADSWNQNPFVFVIEFRKL